MGAEKEALRAQFQKDWKKYYNLDFFKKNDFVRKKCSSCGVNFWTQDSTRDVCNEAKCLGGYTFIGKSPAKAKLDYVDTWNKFSEIMTGLGYTEIKRYPTIARWRDDTWFTEGSIYCFQPHVVSGEVAPPANPLIIPQPSLRFNDIDNVGVTSSHYTLHVHMGQHAFMPPEKFSPTDYLTDIYTWLIKGLKIPSRELTFHEDVWAGGGSFGTSFEFFCRGLEIGNQVYHWFRGTPKNFKPLELNVLDMGEGLERTAWITHGTPTSYEIAFDPVDNKYMNKIGLKYDKKLFAKFAPYAGFLNVNEVENIEDAWKNVAKKVGVTSDELKSVVLPLKAFYSVLDHSRTLLFAIADGALPSNSGGGYNLRFILRRALRFIEQFGWDISLIDLAGDHARAFTGKMARTRYGADKEEELIEVGLQPMFDELIEKLPDVEKVLEHEMGKYKETKQRAASVLGTLFEKKKTISTPDLIKLYDSQGILPEDIQAAAEKQKISLKIPSDFYSKVAEQHMEKKIEEPKEARKIDAKIPPTYLLYYDDEHMKDFEAKVLKIIDGHYVILNETAFYPEGGGQSCDLGTLDEKPVTAVEKVGKHILHEMDDIDFKEGDLVVGKIDWNRRIANMRHHTSAHVVNGAARRLLGDHIWQAGSEITPEKGRLDITHFAGLSQEELQKIEWMANEIVLEDLPVNKFVLPKDQAEKKYGFRLYQGGAIPGAELRIIETPGFDVEACGGTHVDKTSEIGFIKILSSKKIQDGIIRLEFAAGQKALEEMQKSEKYLKDASNIFSVQPEHLAKTCQRFFDEWKQMRKQVKKEK